MLILTLVQVYWQLLIHEPTFGLLRGRWMGWLYVAVAFDVLAEIHIVSADFPSYNQIVVIICCGADAGNHLWVSW
jgi:hypothetical protein